MSTSSRYLAKVLGESEVDEFQIARSLINDDIFCLQVSVDYALLVEEVE